MISPHNSLIVFQDKKIRRLWHENEWFYSVVDIVEVLTDSHTPRQYWGKVKQREFVDLQLSPIWVQLKLESVDGKKYKTDCVNTKNALRLIQSIPSKKAEPFKMWLAEVGKERLDEIENPELAQERMEGSWPYSRKRLRNPDGRDIQGHFLKKTLVGERGLEPPIPCGN